jgi:hypothetical protein
MLRRKEKSLSLSRIEFWLSNPFYKPVTVLTELSRSSVGNQGIVLGSTLPFFARYKRVWRNLMGLSGGKQSNGKQRWRWAGIVKMDFYDRLCTYVGVGGLAQANAQSGLRH